MWREGRIQALLATEDHDILFVSGCAENMGRFLPQFDQIILLSASADLMVERLATRTNNPYGKQPDEVTRILNQKEIVEPLLRSIAGHEIDTSAPLATVVEEVLRRVGNR